MINVTLYTRPDCPECDQALADLESLQEQIPHRLVTINIESDRAMKDRFGERVPVVEIGPYHLWPPLKRQDLQVMLSAAQDRVKQLEKVDHEGYQKLVQHGQTMTFSDRLSLWMSQYYIWAVNLFILIYVGLPFLAPVLMKANATFPANIIYKVYSPLCHQLAFRSWFLFGEQAFYPRAMAGIDNMLTYEQAIGNGSDDVFVARDFIGNETVGYKVALCERDVAIYGAMLLFGLVFAVFGRRLRAVPWYVWVILGLGPMGIDGVSQLPSIASNLPSWVPMRESTPLLRSITGFMFGWVTAWYLYPMIEESMRETRRIVLRKKAFIQE
jgi:uncharacterized membrane protein